MEAGGAEVQGHSQLHSKCEARKYQRWGGRREREKGWNGMGEGRKRKGSHPDLCSQWQVSFLTTEKTPKANGTEKEGQGGCLT